MSPSHRFNQICEKGQSTEALKYTIVPGNAMHLLIKGLEDGFPTSESFQSIYDAALAANIAPQNYTSRIPSISYDSNRERYVDYIETKLAVRWTKLAVRSVQHYCPGVARHPKLES